MAHTITLNPDATPMIEAWKAAKEAEKAWAEHRRALEEQIYALHPNLIDSIQATLGASSALSVSASLADPAHTPVLKVEIKREFVLDQVAVTTLVADFPTLEGTLFKRTWTPTASRALFSALQGNTELSAELRQVVSFKPQRPYLTSL